MTFYSETLKPRLQQARVLVVGDVMLDRYWFGDVSRISPEAPVPVAKIEKTEHRAGGAANVARNQQLIRLDFEDTPTHEVLDGVKNRFCELLAECDVVILSDYGKGGLTHVVSFIEWARQAGKPVLIDPKGDDYAKYTGATLLTPNRAELRQVTGSWKNEADLQEKARALRRNLDLQALLLTRSEEGMTLFRDGEPHHQPTQAREVFDVSGAGDTVIAGMGLAMAAGLDFPEAMQLANAAAGVVVGKLGTAVCSFDELAQSL